MFCLRNLRRDGNYYETSINTIIECETKNEVIMELNNKLKELRISRNMTQEAVAEHLGVSSQTVSKWERGVSLS